MTDLMQKNPFSLRLASVQVFLVSLSLMLFEINLIRLFSVVMFYHLAFFVLAIALFGIGLGGLYAHMRRSGETDALPRLTPYLPLLLGIGVIGVLFLLVHLPLQSSLNVYPFQIRWIFLVFLGTMLPFFFGGIFLSRIFAARPQWAGALYFGDLLGAGAGCFLAIPALEWLGGTYTPFLVGMLAAASSFLAPGSVRPSRLASLGVLAGIAILGLASYRWNLAPAPIPDPDHNVEFSKWNFFSNIVIQPYPEWKGWRLSPKYDGPIPQHLRLTQDGRAPAFLERFDGDFGPLAYLRYDITSLPFRVAQPKKALIIGAGGGRDILTAKLYGVSEIQGVELNPITAAAMRGPFREYTGNIYGLDGVDVAVENGRTFVRRDKETYDLVFLSLADTQAASAQGAYVLSENHLYTVEAFEAYWDRLGPDGVCCVVSSTGWADFLLRMATSAAVALERKGISDPASHIIVMMTHDYPYIGKGMCIALSKTPIGPALLERARQSCEELGFSVVWPAQTTPHEWTDRVRGLLNAAARPGILKSAYEDLSPLWDDRPYLFYALKPVSFVKLLFNPSGGPAEMRWHVRSFQLLVDFFLVAFVCVFALMLAPLIWFRRSEIEAGRRAHQGFFLGIFFLLGISFMLVEVSLLQSIFLMMGNPTLTFAVTLGVMLVFTGIGSMLSGRVDAGSLRPFLVRAAIAAAGLQIAAVCALPVLAPALQGASLALKFGFVLVLMALLATPMGMLFPSALRLAASRGFDMTCWVWGMNGVGSVLGSVCATIVAMNLGIRAVFMVGIAGYVLIALLAFCLRRYQTAMN
ncbi:MAG TPA: hypothetical protein P5318_12990 [Candidatus Hydrogenedentes bacterium]|nr:hypothetical protein [Candidatus Hydrogenedentota bacterium]HRT21034.1 hypothetical protein [Candidatus Hydrogenedentota bacterium]HRT65863.1 hypothetical protein [Candidatus Hydrogenedentota bacterium]